MVVHRILDRLRADGWGPDIAAMSEYRAQIFNIIVDSVARSYYDDGLSLFVSFLADTN